MSNSNKWLRHLAVLLIIMFTLPACVQERADTKERRQVGDQQQVYNRAQPIPRYDWSLARQLWIEFYDAQNKQVTTFSSITAQTGGAPLFDCPSLGYAIPRDTQLTNPHQIAQYRAEVIDQAEPNGLFTGPHSDATIMFCLNDSGTVAPVYTEQKVTSFPFPVEWKIDAAYPRGHWVRVGQASNIELSTVRPQPPAPVNAAPPKT